MRIAAISNSRIPSLTANSIQAMKMCAAMTQLGHAVRLFVPAETAPEAWEALAARYGLAESFPIEWLRSRPGWRRLDFVWSARKRAREMGAELTYTWLPQAAALEASAGRPTVLEMHADVAGRLGAWWLRRAMSSNATRLLTTTAALRRALERSTRTSFADTAVQIAPNGIDLERYENQPDPQSARITLGLPEGFTVGYTGHFYPGRGIELLFELARILPKQRFLWVGGTSEVVEQWRLRLEAAGIRNVTLTGFIENRRLPVYQAAADVLLMPYGRSVSGSSGQEIADVINPMKMFEYMAAQRPIISAALPVIREVLDETRAVFCPPGDLDCWCRTILELEADANRRRKLAERARSHVEQHTWLRRAERALQRLNEE